MVVLAAYSGSGQELTTAFHMETIWSEGHALQLDSSGGCKTLYVTKTHQTTHIKRENLMTFKSFFDKAVFYCFKKEENYGRIIF